MRSDIRPDPFEHVLAYAVIGALAISPIRAETPPEPPLRIASQAPLQSVRLGLAPIVPGRLGRGEMLVHVSSTWTNIWVDHEPELLLDYEALDSRVGVSYGLTSRTELQVDLENRRAFGGVLDSFIQNFHRHIGNGLNGRDTVPRDTVNIEIRDRNGQLLFARRDLGPFSRGAAVSIAHSRPLARGTLAWAGTVRVPVQHDGDNVWNTVDTAGSLAWSRRIGGRSLHAGVALTRFRHFEIEHIPLRATQKTAFLSVVQPLTRRTALIAQYLFNEGAARSGPLARSAHEATLGGRVQVTPKTAIDVGVIENLIHFDNGPDFGIHVAVTRRVR